MKDVFVVTTCNYFFQNVERKVKTMERIKKEERREEVM